MKFVNLSPVNRYSAKITVTASIAQQLSKYLVCSSTLRSKNNVKLSVAT